MKIGVLAIQGAFIEHKNCLEKLKIDTVLVKYKKQLDEIDGLIIPGGESTAISIIANWKDEIQKFIAKNKPIWGTCAGIILLANEVLDNKKFNNKIWGGLNCSVKRNFYGSQLMSFTTDLEYPKEFNKNGSFSAIFIRAPSIINAGKNTKILLKYNNDIIAIQQNKLLGTTFHPELTDNLTWHQYFISLIDNN